MTGRLEILRRRHAMLVLIAVAWLPYVSSRCIEGPPSGCPMEAARVRAASRPEPAGATHHHGADHDGSTPARSCCDLTGKCAVEPAAATATPTVDPGVTWISIPRFPVPVGTPRLVLTVVDVAHHPPPYIRFVTLLL